MKVVLVDEKDNVIGKEEKIIAHQRGLLHRAFSIFIFNSKRELLLQKRASLKYHSGNLWTNTCCSHLSKKGDIINQARKRLKEEMGFDCNLKEKFFFIYYARLENSLIENEYDHVLFGKYNADPQPNPKEVSEWKWISIKELKQDIKKNPANYTPWLKIVLQKASFKLSY